MTQHLGPTDQLLDVVGVGNHSNYDGWVFVKFSDDIKTDFAANKVESKLKRMIETPSSQP